MVSIVRIKLSDKLLLLNNLKKLCHGNNYYNKISLFHTSSPKNVIELKMPSLSPTMSEGTIVNWHKKEGEAVNPGDVLCEIQTDKAVMAFEIEEEGVLAKIMMGDNSKDVKVGSLIALLAEHGEDWKSVREATKSSTASLGTVQRSSEIVREDSDKFAKEDDKQHGKKNSKQQLPIMGPAARGLLERYGLSASSVPATGPRGSLLKGDVLNYISREKLLPIEAHSASEPPASPKISSAVKKSTITSKVSGKQGNVLIEQEYQDIDISSIRHTIAKRLSQSKAQIAHAYHTVNCNMNSVISFRNQLKSEGIEFSINDVIVKAVGSALSLCPNVNVIWKGDQLITPASIDVCIAVATNTGLITPIVTDVPVRGIQDIGKTIRALAERARLGKLLLHEFQGGCFTISNLGMFGINEFSAIINPPQCAILAVGGNRLILGENGKPVTMMSTTLSYDGEAISAVEAAKFMSILQELLREPQNLILAQHPQLMSLQDSEAALVL